MSNEITLTPDTDERRIRHKPSDPPDNLVEEQMEKNKLEKEGQKDDQA